MRNLSFLFIAFLLLLSIPSPVLAQKDVSTDSAVSSSSITPTPEPLYSLPYPGLLPDSPLYFLKVSRDRVISFLISDSLRKAEFDILQADKRLSGGVKLVEKKNYVLAESTFSKGLNYFESSIGNIQQAKKEGRDIKPLWQRMKLSIGKHAEIFSNLIKTEPKEKEGYFQESLKRATRYQTRVKELMPQN